MKRKPLRLFLLLALLAPLAAKAQQYVTIGNSQSPFSTGLLPVATGWYYSLSQQIYTSDEIGMTGYISSIAFEYIVNESFSIESVQVYMKNVSKSYFESNTDMVSLDGATKVFEGTFTVQGPGWVTIQFDTPFFYDGTSNLLLCCYDPTEGLIQWNSELWFRTTKANSNRSICYYSNEYCPDINDLSNYQGYYANGDYNINNIRLRIFPYIYFQDQLVEEICLENWDFNHDNNLSYAEAAAVTTLGLNFKDKNGINHLDILEYFTGLSTLHRYEFQNCEWLEEIAIPRAVSQIDPSIFDGCSRLQYITVDPNNTTYTSLNGCNGIFKNLGDGYKLVAGCKSTVIPEGVTAIGEGALENLPMSTLTLPSTLQTIESYGIHQIDGLENLTVNAVTPPSITEYFLYGTPRTIPVIVPVESLAAYYNYNNTGQPWGGFTNIIADGNISFVDPAVKAICVANWDSNGDGELSYAEAAAVTTLNPSGIWDNSVFKSNTTITSFDELQYFNGLTNTGGCAFEGCEHLTSITLPPNLEWIGSGAFRHCHNLSSVDIPNSVTFIGSYAFEDCVQLTSITLPPNLESIESCAFNLCYNLSSVNIPDGVTLIGVLAFSYCQLTSIDIPNSVTQIGSLVFRGCPLSSVNIPASIRIIDSNPFYGCEPLASITVDAGNPVYSSPNGCNAIIKTDERRLISGCKNTVIPNDVTEINDFAFSDCTGLSSIEIPASVEIINDYAFKGCFNLEYITVLAETPPIISIYSENCFNGVPSTIPVYVPYQSVSAYKNATGWNHFTNFFGIVTIGDETSINTDYTLPVNMDYNYSLTQQIYTAEEIGTTGAITSIAFDYTNTLSFTTEGMKVYMKNVDKTTFDSDTDMVDLSDATLVYDGTFAASRAGWVSLQLQTPFYYDGNSNLLLCCYDPTVSYPGIEIEFRLTTTGDNYSALTYFSDEYNPDINDISSFDGEKYRLKYRNNIYLAINPNIQFADAAVKTICVDNWDSNGDGELSYAEAAAVTSLGEVFKNNDNITSFNELQYFTGLTSINNDAFSGCWSLAAVTLPPLVQAIGEFSFYGCNFSSFVIPNSVTSIGGHAFRSCGALTSITIPSSVTSIGENPFFSCPALATITVEAGNTVYSSPEGSNAIIKTEEHKLVSGCKNTVIPEGVTTIGASAFGGCSSLTEIHIPSSVTLIDAWAFMDCSGLTAITIPSLVNFIGNAAFYGCTGITSITVEAATPPTLEEGAFDNALLDKPVYVPCGSLEAYQNYNNTGTPWGGFTNIHDLCENPLCVAPTNVEVTSTEPQGGYNGFTFTFMPGVEGQMSWEYYISESPVLPETYQEMVANGWLGSTNQTVGSYYPTDEDELAMEGTTYYLWVGYNCGTEGDPDIVWSEGPTMVTIPSEIVYNLTSGVNWWAPLAPITMGELKSQLYGIPVVINSQNGGFLYSDGNDNWSGTLSKSDDYIIQPGEMYKIVIKDDSSKDVYVFAVPQTWTNVELQHGYNWFGYTGNAETIADAIGPNSPPTNGDKIIDKDGNVATFTANNNEQGGTWSGDFTQLQKGHGYVYYSAADGPKPLYLQ